MTHLKKLFLALCLVSGTFTASIEAKTFAERGRDLGQKLDDAEAKLKKEVEEAKKKAQNTADKLKKKSEQVSDALKETSQDEQAEEKSEDTTAH